MDDLHSNGVDFICFLQETLRTQTDQMLLLSHMGDPRNAFLIYFPIAFCLCPSVGQKVLWIAAISEWLNAVLKWILFGHRPYWWVHESSLYTEETRPDILQFPITCETGPGSPSGHAMVTSSVWFIMITAFLRYKSNQQQHPEKSSHGFIFILSWLLFTLMITMVAISRLFIAAHFPHQVLLGTLVGILLAVLFNRISTDDLPLHFYVMGSGFILITAIGLYGILQLLQLDPGWTVSLAIKWCSKKEYIHLDTTPFYALSRDAGCVFGLGAVLAVRDKFKDKLKDNINFLAKVIAIFACLIYCSFIESVKPQSENIIFFYFLGFLKNSLIPVGVVFIRTLISYLFCKSKRQ
ncbi:LOW QUALITY PROTEIN: glucose-6-phosphatase 2-like [Saccoglossus kowalevskii]|uniref:Glucose-6-phosphatase n=1 Tax=Saccoglossus kowalevskii TaxID=10224 RepID=A0ABM0MI35_SACKO|nr:PREDICTED: LOW QUALITY PROTEIN: glucose-6-phosphatase 2-like [Saccoglossus kowalevskii]